MITESTGNLLAANVEALVNTVNTKGVMGKGIALQFKRAYPAMFKDYAAAARHGQVELGRMHVWPTDALDGPQYIINFPTKEHWKSPSRLSDIESGLNDLVRVVQDLRVSSIAVPPLGCGNGGLDWSMVEPRIRAAFEAVPEVDVRIYAPVGAPPAADMPNNTTRPELNPPRAALIGIVDRYRHQALDNPTLIEVQKLMYFLQRFGEQLNLKFEANRYGPYADSLRHVLVDVEGHYLTGYGDGSAKVLNAAPLATLPGAVEKAELLLNVNPDTKSRMEKVLELADGFESAYGMELLATVDWIASGAVGDVSDSTIAQKVADWSPRKARMFTARHVDIALSALRENALLV